MAWPFMDSQAKGDLVVDQFLMEIECHTPRKPATHTKKNGL